VTSANGLLWQSTNAARLAEDGVQWRGHLRAANHSHRACCLQEDVTHQTTTNTNTDNVLILRILKNSHTHTGRLIHAATYPHSDDCLRHGRSQLQSFCQPCVCSSLRPRRHQTTAATDRERIACHTTYRDSDYCELTTTLCILTNQQRN